jgi:hypothetical protein
MASNGKAAKKDRNKEAKGIPITETKVEASTEDLDKEAIISNMEKLGSMVSSQDGIRYEGDALVLPERMRGNLQGAIEQLRQFAKSEESVIEFNRTFLHRPYDGAVAFSRAMALVFGGQGIGKVTKTAWGDIEPKLISVQTGIDEFTEAPWGKIGFKPLDAEFNVGYNYHEDLGVVSHITCKAPRKYKNHIEGFWAIIDTFLSEHSIYRGKMITAAEMTPGFVNPYSFAAEDIIYPVDVMSELTIHLFTPIMKTKRLLDDGVQVKSGILLAGKYGTGKSLAALLAAQKAVENGWTFVTVRADDDPFDALSTASIYSPAVVFIEDLDNLVAQRSRQDVSRLLDAVDSAHNKGVQVILLTTTNFLDKIDKAMLRPGRIDHVIEFGDPDPEAHRKIIESVIPDIRRTVDINYAEVAEAFAGLLPAFASEAARTAYLAKLSVSDGAFAVGTKELIEAAAILQEQRKRMEGSNEAKHEHVPDMTSTTEDAIARVLQRATVLGRPVEVAPPVR